MTWQDAASGPRPPVAGPHPRKGHPMSLQDATELIRHSLVMVLIVSAPMLIIGLVVGVVISLLQALTQIQEQTLAFAPKIVAMIAAAIILMPWIGQKLLDYSAAMFGEGRLP